MKVVYSPECLAYDTPGHPENPERVLSIYNEMKAAGFSFTKCSPAEKKDVLLVHSEEYYEKIRKAAYTGFETPPIDIKYPLLSAGATIKASGVMGFALTRPPGHHAGRNSQEGFCYFNSIAIAVRKLGKKTAILDIDVHHGNGTQSIFLGDSNVSYHSLHQAPLYPMSGLKSEGNCYNYPLFPDTDEATYIKTLEKALQVIESGRPEVLAISMGFDSYVKDPLAGQKITEDGYGKIGKMIKEMNIPSFVTLEGGYSPDIGKLAVRFFSALSSE